MAPFNLQSSFRTNQLHVVMHRTVHHPLIPKKFQICVYFSSPSIFISFSLVFTYFLFRLLSSFILLYFVLLPRYFLFLLFTFISLISFSVLFFFISSIFFTFYFLPHFLSFYPSCSVVLFLLSFPYASIFLDNLRICIALFNFIFIYFITPNFSLQKIPRRWISNLLARSLSFRALAKHGTIINLIPQNLSVPCCYLR